MKITKLYTGNDGRSHFQEIDSGPASKEQLGMYSKPVNVTSMIFRDFQKGEFFDWHNAPEPQYIVYLEGEVEVEASGGGKKIFRPGDVLFVEDLTGAGHITRTLSKGRSVIVKTVT
jgi:quercetin dioxygenase-like cupin family protein